MSSRETTSNVTISQQAKGIDNTNEQTNTKNKVNPLAANVAIAALFMVFITCVLECIKVNGQLPPKLQTPCQITCVIVTVIILMQFSFNLFRLMNKKSAFDLQKSQIDIEQAKLKAQLDNQLTIQAAQQAQDKAILEKSKSALVIDQAEQKLEAQKAIREKERLQQNIEMGKLEKEKLQNELEIKKLRLELAAVDATQAPKTSDSSLTMFSFIEMGRDQIQAVTPELQQLSNTSLLEDTK